jgi:hypothetical protein
MAKTYGRLTLLNSGLVKLANNCRDVKPDYEKVIDSFMVLTAVAGEEQMKEKARWRDDGGNRKDRVPGEARAALSTTTDLARPDKRIRFSHGVDYGIWLEISNHGKFQIIMPTVAAQGRKLMKNLRGTLSALRE